MKKRPTFKPYLQHQGLLIPPTYDELIPLDHPVRVVSAVIDQINIDFVIKRYFPRGCSSYHPRMLLKILVYGYLCNIYHSRKLEAATRENIHFMWLSGMAQPDHNTINRFRSERLKGVIKKVFTQVVLMMAGAGHVDLKTAYTDGTKIEANANRYSFVWGKTVRYQKERILAQLEELWEYTQKVAAKEALENAPTQYTKINPEDVRKTIERIDEAISDSEDIPKEIKKKVKRAKKNWPDKMEEYIEKEVLMQGRNSCSKTDPDATFMRMKEDHFHNGQLKPAYNTQISTHNQIITNYTIHQNAADTTTLKAHLQSYQESYGFMPDELVADAGYGSEENYEFLEKQQVEAYVKYNYFDKEQKKNAKVKTTFHPDNLFYNTDRNCYYCPMGQQMTFVGNVKTTTETGYIRTLSRYKALNCNGCPMRGPCCKSKGDRIIEVSHKLNEYKRQVNESLLSEKGLTHRKQRPVDVEPVFGMIKHNRGYRRFLLRGIEKVSVEFGLLAIAHNLKKIASFAFLYSIFAPCTTVWSRSYPDTNPIKVFC